MVKSMFAAIAGLRTHQSKMDVISNNIANVNTWGFKSRTANFEDAMYQNLTNSTAGNANGAGGVNSSQLGYGVNMGSITTNFTSGSRGFTGDSLNCMIDGPGFFIVSPTTDPIDAADLQDVQNNPNSASLTRVGIFAVDSNGYLVDATGNYIMGFQQTAGNWDQDQLVALRIPNVQGGTDREDIQTYKVGTDGVITGVTQDNRQVTIGKVAVASVENPNGLEQTAGYLYSIGANSGTVNAVFNNASMVLSNYLEMSNVDLATDMSNMITTQRGYQANSKIITVTDEMLEQLVNMKR